MESSTPKFTKSELELTEKIGAFLMPIVRDVVDARVSKLRGDPTAKFCREFGELHRARDFLPASSGAMARVELELKMLELAGAFVSSQTKE